MSVVLIEKSTGVLIECGRYATPGEVAQVRDRLRAVGCSCSLAVDDAAVDASARGAR